MSDTVDMIASGYEWTCLFCESLNDVYEIGLRVRCENCGREFAVGEVHHAYG